MKDTDMTSESASKSTAEGSSLYANVPLEPIPSLLQQFDIAQPGVFEQKLTALCGDPDILELWTDFDNTLSTKNGSVWEALRNALPPAGKAESDAERKINLAKERAGVLTPEEHIAWSQRELGRYVRYGVTEDDIAQAVAAMSLRTGARELFRLCAEMGIDRYIVSTSIADAIELVVELHSPRVHSNRLRIKDGVVIGWDETGMLHSGNKHIHAARILAGQRRKNNGWKIVLGDNRHDADMITHDKALRIRMSGKHGNTQSYLKESFTPSALSPGFDLVLRTDTLMPIVDMLKWILAHRPAGGPKPPARRKKKN